jgi:hypothetical protein
LCPLPLPPIGWPSVTGPARNGGGRGGQLGLLAAKRPTAPYRHRPCPPRPVRRRRTRRNRPGAGGECLRG